MNELGVLLMGFLTLLLVGGVVLALGTSIPQRVALGLELVVGARLIALGADVLRRLFRRKIHVHVHTHGTGMPHVHAHSHVAAEARHEHAHARALPLDGVSNRFRLTATKSGNPGIRATLNPESARASESTHSLRVARRYAVVMMQTTESSRRAPMTQQLTCKVPNARVQVRPLRSEQTVLVPLVHARSTDVTHGCVEWFNYAARPDTPETR